METPAAGERIMMVLGPVDSRAREPLGKLDVNNCCSVTVWEVGLTTWVEAGDGTCRTCVLALQELVAALNAGERPKVLSAAGHAADGP